MASSAPFEEQNHTIRFDFENIHLPSLRYRYLAISQTLRTFVLSHLPYLACLALLYLQIIARMNIKFPLFLAPFAVASICIFVREVLLIVRSYNINSSFYATIEINNDDWRKHVRSKRRMSIKMGFEELFNLVAYAMMTLNFSKFENSYLSYSLIPLFAALMLRLIFESCPYERTARFFEFLYNF
jgi:hypothetical protein